MNKDTFYSEIKERINVLKIERDELILDLNIGNEYKLLTMTQEEKNTLDISKISRVLEINNTLQMLKEIIEKRKEDV